MTYVEHLQYYLAYTLLTEEQAERAKARKR